MGKTKKSFHNDDYDLDEDERGLHMHSEKRARYHERQIDLALKTKNVGILLELEEQTLPEDITEEIIDINEDYSSCIECGKVLITEEDYKGASHFFQPSCDLHGENSPEISEWTCLTCLKNDIEFDGQKEYYDDCAKN